jgi:hypothetical protein
LKHIAGSGKRCLISYNWECSYANGIIVVAEGIDIPRLGAIATGGRIISSGNFSLFEKDFGWMDIW